jgi:predicted Zn-dependent protease
MKSKIKLLSLTLILLMSILSPTAFANDSTHLNKLGYTSASNLKYHLLSGVDKYGFTSMAESAVNSWNNISSLVSISKESSYSTSTPVVIDVKETVTGCSCYGVAEYYVNTPYGPQQVTKDDKRDRTVISIDNHQLTVWYNFMSNTDQKHVFVHELGHALSLAHNDDVSPSVMHSSSFDAQAAIKTTDRYHLQLKWGY